MGMKTVTPYDSLIVAAGAQQSYFGNDEFATFAPGMKTIDDALELRGRILGAFEAAEVATDPAERRSPAHLRGGRCRADRRRAGRRDRPTRRTHPGGGISDHHAQRVPGHPARRRARGVAADGPEAGPQGATAAGKDGCRGPAQRDGDRRRLHGHHDQGQGRRRAPHRMRVQGVGGRRRGQPAGQDDRRTVRRNRNRPRRTGNRGARPHRQGTPERLRRRRSDVRARRARDGPGRDPGGALRHHADQARGEGTRRSGQPQAVQVLRQGQHGPHLPVQRRRAGRQAGVRRFHRLVGVAGAAPVLPGRPPQPHRRHVRLGYLVPGSHARPDGHHQPDDLRPAGGATGWSSKREEGTLAAAEHAEAADKRRPANSPTSSAPGRYRRSGRRCLPARRRCGPRRRRARSRRDPPGPSPGASWSPGG